LAGTDFRKALGSADELQITVVGRKTGKKISIPVWFVADGQKLLLLPVGGSSSNWYKNVVKKPEIELAVSGKKATAEARPMTDKKEIADILDMFSVKYGASEVKKYYPKQDAAVGLSI
jgi:deazaflavin-dependent oxidoreductase (nitroreductase family)